MLVSVVIAAYLGNVVNHATTVTSVARLVSMIGVMVCMVIIVKVTCLTLVHAQIVALALNAVKQTNCIEIQIQAK